MRGEERESWNEAVEISGACSMGLVLFLGPLEVGKVHFESGGVEGEDRETFLDSSSIHLLTNTQLEMDDQVVGVLGKLTRSTSASNEQGNWRGWSRKR